MNYQELSLNLINGLKKGFNKIIFTDLFIKDSEFVRALNGFEKILIIDHHRSSDLNSKKIVFVKGEDGYSAGYLCYYLFSKIKNLEHLDWIVALSCISDYCHIKPKNWLEKIFKKYNDELVYKKNYVRKSGRIWDLQYKLSLALIYFEGNLKKVFSSIGKGFGSIGNLEKCAQIIQEEINKTLRKFDKEKEKFDEGYLFIFQPKFSIGSLISTITSNTEPSKVFIIVCPGKDFYFVSVRRQDKKLDCVKFLQKLLNGLEHADGGGHIPAAGGRFLKKDLPKFKKRLGLINKNI